MRLYIAGPMTGLPEFNYPAFNAAEKRLLEQGYEVVNPARPYAVEPTSWKGYMSRALADVASCDGLALLPGAHESRGARLEMLVARRLDMPLRPVDGWCHGDTAPSGYDPYCPACSTDEGDYTSCLRVAS